MKTNALSSIGRWKARLVACLPGSLLMLLSLVFICGRACSGQTALPRVEFTKTQDLKADARATNRPVADKWAVVIGINEFAEKSLNNNLGMDRAARDFFAYLVDPRYGRFDRDHVRLLTNDEATRQNILSATGPQWLGQLAGPDDLVVVFIGTHGFPAGDGNTYICASNTVLDNLFATGISMQGFMQSLRKNVKTDRIVLVLQACYSGAAELQSGAKALYKNFNIDLEKVVLGKGYVILSSSRPDQVTWGDIFSRHLIAALKQDEGLVPLRSAFQLAQQRTEYDTTHESVGVKPQTPVIKADWSGNDLVLGVPPVKKIANIPEGAVNYLAAEAHYMLASKHAASGDIDSALSEYRATLAIDPSYADALSDYGSALALKGLWRESAEQFRRAIAKVPDDALYHYNYARALDKLGEREESGRELEKAYALNPKDRVVLTVLADRAVRQGEIATAVRFVGEAIELYPKSAQLHDRLSYLLTRKSDLDSALAHAREAIKLDPQMASARLNLGSILKLKGDIDESIASYREAVRLAPANADAHYLLGAALEARGDAAGARAEFAQFVRLCLPDDARLDRVRKRMSELGSESGG